MFEDRSDRNSGCNPHVLQMFSDAVIHNSFRTFSSNSSERSLKRTNNVRNRDLRSRAIKSVSTVNAATTGHNAVVSKVAQNRFEELHRNVLCGGQGVTLDECAWINIRHGRKFKQGTHRVINFGRHMHGHIQAGGAVNV